MLHRVEWYIDISGNIFGIFLYCISYDGITVSKFFCNYIILELNICISYITKISLIEHCLDSLEVNVDFF